MVVKMDELGRIVIPKPIRKELGMKEKGYIEISTEGSNVILHKHEQQCSFCGKKDKLVKFKGKKICLQCIGEFKDV